MTDFTAETRRLMALKGYSMRKLAREIPCDASDLSKMLRFLKPPTPAIMSRIDEILDAGGTIRDSEPPRSSKTVGAVARRQLGSADADAILSTLAAFRAIDNSSGGGHAYSLAASYLDKSVMPMIGGGTYSEADGRLLFAAASQVAHLAAWSAYDNGTAKPAETYFGKALELAAAAGDGSFTGEVLAARSHRAIHLGVPARAVELARAARHAAAGTPMLAAEAHELEANGHALAGDRTACITSLSACESEFERADPGSTPAWLGYFDTPYLAARIAHTLRDLGDWEAARTKAQEAEALSGSLARASVFNRLMLASAWVQEDRDAAISTGRVALAATAGMQSGRAGAYARDLRKRLKRRYGVRDPHVMSFDEECRQLLGS